MAGSFPISCPNQLNEKPHTQRHDHAIFTKIRRPNSVEQQASEGGGEGEGNVPTQRDAERFGFGTKDSAHQTS